MAFKLYTGNRLEMLADRLCGLLGEPLSDPFGKEIIVVQNRGMETWLRQIVAVRLGICCNFEFPFLNAFVDRVFAMTLPECPDRGYFSPEVMEWRVLQLLENIISEPGFEELRHYVAGASSELKKLQLARRIAYVFDQYQIYRPDMILNWDRQSVSADWQQRLWQIVSGGKFHRAAGFKAFFELEAPELTMQNLERVSVFGIASMPPVYLSFFQKLGEFIPVNFFYCNPCREEWSMHLSDPERKWLTRKLEQKGIPEELQHWDDEANPLLASMGQAGREFFSTVLSNTDYDPDSIMNSFIDPGEDTLLHAVQSDILNAINRREPVEVGPKDCSIQIHNCHNRMREAEILFDNLLDIFGRNPNTAPRDVLVMTPDISLYAPYIQAVFEREKPDSERYIPYSISDRPPGVESRIIKAFFELTKLAESKFNVTAIMDIFELEAVHANFGIAPEGVETIRKWLSETAVCWGIDGEHRAELLSSGGEPGPAFEENSWRAGLNRMLAGYALNVAEDSTGLFNDSILPYSDIEGESAVLLGKFSRFIDRLFDLRQTLRGAGTVSAWHDILSAVLDTFFINNNETYGEKQEVRYALAKLNECAGQSEFSGTLHVKSVTDCLTEYLNDIPSEGGFLRGRVTFCTMQPMRNIPRKVICLLGMDDGAYPRQPRRPGFDIMGREARLCDRSRRTEDRYIFLEALLAARDIFYVSYNGRTSDSNELLPPSVVVSELRDYAERIRSEAGNNRPLETVHRLQAFNFEYFDNSSQELFSYSLDNCRAAAALAGNRNRRIFLKDQLPPPEDALTEISPETLIEFFSNPAKYFMRNRLNIRFENRRESQLSDTEPFDIASGLDSYKLNDRIIRMLLGDGDELASYKAVKASGMLPAGEKGRTTYFEHVVQIRDFINETRSVLGGKSLYEALQSETNVIEPDFELERWRICGRIENVGSERQLLFRYASVKGKDAIKAAVSNLVLCAAGIETPETVCIGKDKEYHLPAMPQAEAVKRLVGLLEIFEEGMRRPLPFFPNTAFSLVSGGRVQDTWSGYKSWYADDWISGECEDPYIGCFFGGELNDLPEYDEFEALSQQLFWQFIKAPRAGGKK